MCIVWLDHAARWAEQRIAEHWTYGLRRDDEAKTSLCLVPNDRLLESEKQCDRKLALETLKVIQTRGYRLVSPDTSGSRSDGGHFVDHFSRARLAILRLCATGWGTTLSRGNIDAADQVLDALGRQHGFVCNLQQIVAIEPAGQADAAVGDFDIERPELVISSASQVLDDSVMQFTGLSTIQWRLTVSRTLAIEWLSF